MKSNDTLTAVDDFSLGTGEEPFKVRKGFEYKLIIWFVHLCCFRKIFSIIFCFIISHEGGLAIRVTRDGAGLLDIKLGFRGRGGATGERWKKQLRSSGGDC